MALKEFIQSSKTFVKDIKTPKSQLVKENLNQMSEAFEAYHSYKGDNPEELDILLQNYMDTLSRDFHLAYRSHQSIVWFLLEESGLKERF